MITGLILILLAMCNLPHMIQSKRNLVNYVSFGFCMGLAVASFAEYFINQHT